jgi:hypothetical protein
LQCFLFEQVESGFVHELTISQSGAYVQGL